MTTPVKHPQWILAVMREALVDLGFNSTDFSSYNFDAFIAAIEPYCLFRQRAALEKDAGQPQLLPYAVLRQKTDDGWQYFPARRTREGGEPKLWDLVTVAYADHIDWVDAAFKPASEGQDLDVAQSTVDIKETIRHAVYRELCEEVLVEDRHGREIDLHDLINFTNNYINDNTNNVNPYHLAIMVTIDIPADGVVSIKPRQGLEAMPPMHLWQLDEIMPQLESWTGIFVKSMYCENALVDIPLLSEQEVIAYSEYGRQLTAVLDAMFAPFKSELPFADAYIEPLQRIIHNEYMKKWTAVRGKGVFLPSHLHLNNAVADTATLLGTAVVNDEFSTLTPVRAPDAYRYPIGAPAHESAGMMTKTAYEIKPQKRGNIDGQD
jgi:predicted NUDIX family phosphoesterase